MKNRAALQSIGNLPQADLNNSRRDDSKKHEDASSVRDIQLRAAELLELDINKTRSMTNDEQLEYLFVLKRLRSIFASKRDELLKAIEPPEAPRLSRGNNENRVRSSVIESEKNAPSGGSTSLYLSEKILQPAQREENDETEELLSTSGSSSEEVIPDSQPDATPLKRKVEYNAADYETPKRQYKHVNDEAYSSASKWPSISPEDALEHRININDPFSMRHYSMTTPVSLKGTSEFTRKIEKENMTNMISSPGDNTISGGNAKMTPTLYDNMRPYIPEAASSTHVEFDLKMDEFRNDLKFSPHSGRDASVLDLGQRKNLEKNDKVNLESIELSTGTSGDKNQVKVKDTSVDLLVSQASASHEYDNHKEPKYFTSSPSISSETTAAEPAGSNDKKRRSLPIDPTQIATLNYHLSTPPAQPSLNPSLHVTNHLELPSPLLSDSLAMKSKPNCQTLSRAMIDPDSTVPVSSPSILPKGDSHEGLAMVCLPQGEIIFAVVCGNMMSPNGKARIAVLTESFIRIWAADYETVGEKNAWTCDFTIKRQQDANGYLDDMTCLSFNADDTALLITERIRNPISGNPGSYYCEDHFTINDMSKNPALVINLSSEVLTGSTENIDKSPLRMVLSSGRNDFGTATLGQSSRSGVDVIKFGRLENEEKRVERISLPLDTAHKFLISRSLISLCSVKNQPDLVIGTFDDFLVIWNVTTIELLSFISPKFLPRPLASFQSSLSCVAAVVPKTYADQIQFPQNSINSHLQILGVMARLRKPIEGEYVIPAGHGLEMITLKFNGSGATYGYEGSEGALFEEVVVSERLVVGSVPGKGIAIWDKPSCKMQSFLELAMKEDSWKPFKMAIHPSGSYIVTGDEAGCLHLYFDDYF